jgi:predicted phage terminase large subunit-like protein
VLSSPADVVIAGGAAGGGKTFGLLLEPLRHVDNPRFGAVIFRRETPQITNEGGLWDESGALYPQLGATPNQNDLSWTFKSGAKVRFSHMQHATDRFAWDGAQIPLIGWDQLESFLEAQWWYLFSRNRSVCGVRPYIRATCNPVPDDDDTGGWLHRLISWWIDPETGLAIPSRSGVIRYMARINEVVEWADSEAELRARFPHVSPDKLQPKSFTFIPSRLSDNRILTTKDPGYIASLMALPLVERERLLGGNWKIKAAAGTVLNRAWFKTLPAQPTDVVRWVRYWDKAGTEGGGKRSAGVLMGIRRSSRDYVIADVVTGQWSAHNREVTIKQVAEADAMRPEPVEIWVEQEPGSGGKESAENTIQNLAGYTIKAERVTGDKVTRAGPFAAQAEAGNVYLVASSWNELFLAEAHRFDGVHGFMDQIDAASGAFNKLVAVPARVQTEATWGR